MSLRSDLSSVENAFIDINDYQLSGHLSSAGSSLGQHGN